MTKDNDLLAYHEAGHVVVMHAMGYESPGVSVLESEEEGPYARNGFAAGDPVLDLIVTLAAGAAAEDLYHEIQGTGMRFYTSGICLTDFTRVADLIGEDAFSVEAPEQLLEEEWWMDCVDMALSVLRANWTTVNALAEALLKHGALDRAQITEVIRAAGPLTLHSVSTETNTTMAPDAGVRTLPDDARNAARQIRRFTNERDEDDPFHREEIPKNMDSPEGKALEARYDEHMKETRRLYRSDHLPTVVGVRDAFADLGIRDPELDRLHENPKNYRDLRTLADHLSAMGDSLARQARTS